jgi:hypothetical protein
MPQHMKMIKEFKTHVQITFCDVNDVDYWKQLFLQGSLKKIPFANVVHFLLKKNMWVRQINTVWTLGPTLEITLSMDVEMF